MQKLLTELDEIGINTLGGLQRFNFNTELYLGFIQKVLNDQSFLMLDNAVQNNDNKQVLIYASAIQGIASNLGFVSIESKCKKICNLVYHNESIKKEFKDLKKVYTKTIIKLIYVLKGGINEGFNNLS